MILYANLLLSYLALSSYLNNIFKFKFQRIDIKYRHGLVG